MLPLLFRSVATSFFFHFVAGFRAIFRWFCAFSIAGFLRSAAGACILLLVRAFCCCCALLVCSSKVQVLDTAGVFFELHFFF